ncbi:hypothetical protein OOT46_03250 [Aquabacterium sp. A7-Y]|uniref:hypothetical protein n=1 Tax=Aquabacterium sp. A7-Y TaxID=1349605 RepID=UPI00223E8307|nr:hypothetical protein [Aquabacterium sp. A7-Y]MCW7536869.1 hypothetical protein [Aquabacterium sp. A7-Y]
MLSRLALTLLALAFARPASGQPMPECPGIPVGAPIADYRGLSGNYAGALQMVVNRPLNLGLLVVPTDPASPLARGSFSGLFSAPSGVPQTFAGSFIAAPDNPMLPGMLMLEVGVAGQALRLNYRVLGLQRALAASHITALCLYGPLGTDDPQLRPFALYRIGP